MVGGGAGGEEAEEEEVVVVEEEVMVEEEEGGGAAAAAPGLLSERDALDLMRPKKPLRLDSRFFSGASGRPEREERLRRGHSCLRSPLPDPTHLP